MKPFYDAVFKYEKRLGDKFQTWLRKWPKRLAKKRRTRTNAILAVQDLVDDLEVLAIVSFPIAYMLGLGVQELTPIGIQRVAIQSEQNAAFLHTRLAPAVVAKLDMIDEDSWIEEEIALVLATFAARVALYKQPFWTTIWEGFREKVDNIYAETSAPAPVRWILDPFADHCVDCPVFATVYASIDDMLLVTGGFPGASSSECGPGCLCALEEA